MALYWNYTMCNTVNFQSWQEMFTFWVLKRPCFFPCYFQIFSTKSMVFNSLSSKHCICLIFFSFSGSEQYKIIFLSFFISEVSVYVSIHTEINIHANRIFKFLSLLLEYTCKWFWIEIYNYAFFIKNTILRY